MDKQKVLQWIDEVLKTDGWVAEKKDHYDTIWLTKFRDEMASGRFDLLVRRNVADILETIKTICNKADKKYGECWEDQPVDESEENSCDRCGGFLYIEQGGDVVDCPYCKGTGQNLPERIFNQQKFGEWVEENPFFCDIIGSLQELKESNISA